MRPEPGQIYISAAAPDASVIIETVETIPAEDDAPETYYLEACHPDALNDMSEPNRGFAEDEWAEYVAHYRLTLSPHSPALASAVP